MYSRGSQELQLPNPVIWAFLSSYVLLPCLEYLIASSLTALSYLEKGRRNPLLESFPPPTHTHPALTLCSVMEKKRD